MMANERINFEKQAQYKIGTVTYRVTAHYSSQQDTLKSKIEALLNHQISKGVSAPLQADTMCGNIVP